MEPEIAQPTSSHASTRPSHESLDRLEAEITELWGHLTAATYRFLTLVAEFDRSEAYARHGLAEHGAVAELAMRHRHGRGAREGARRARARASARDRGGFARGEFSYSKVRAMTRVATPANEVRAREHRAHGTASHVEKLVRKYRWTQRRDAEKNAQSQHLNRCVHYFFDENDTFVLNARLPPEIGALVAQGARGGERRAARVADGRATTRDELAARAAR